MTGELWFQASALNSQDVANILWGVASLQDKEGIKSTVPDAVFGRVAALKDTLRGKELVNVLWWVAMHI